MTATLYTQGRETQQQGAGLLGLQTHQSPSHDVSLMLCLFLVAFTVSRCQVAVTRCSSTRGAFARSLRYACFSPLLPFPGAESLWHDVEEQTASLPGRTDVAVIPPSSRLPFRQPLKIASHSAHTLARSARLAGSRFSMLSTPFFILPSLFISRLWSGDSVSSQGKSDLPARASNTCTTVILL